MDVTFYIMYPKAVLTKDGKARVLVDKGKFFRYKYVDPKTGKTAEKGKNMLVLKGEKDEYLYLIPLKDGRLLGIKAEKGIRKVLEGKRVIEV